MKKFWGNIVFGIAKFVEWIFNGLIAITSAIISVGELLKAIVLPFAIMLAIGMMVFPPLLLLLFNPASLAIGLILIIVIIIPYLGKKAVSGLEYYKYIVTEYLYDYADYYRLNKDRKGNFSDYGSKYRNQQEEKRRQKEEAFRRAQEERQKAQDEEWRRIFEEFFRQQSGYGRSGNYTGGGYQGSRSGSSYNPYTDFNSQYKKACDVLGLSYDTDIYQVKLNYRKLAKKYHPDINKDPSAPEKFKEITNAYEFLSEENIERYKRINNK